MTKPQFHRYVEWVTAHGAYVYRQAGVHQLTFDFDKTDDGRLRACILRYDEARQVVVFVTTWGDGLPITPGVEGRTGFDAVLLFEELLAHRFPYGPVDFHAQMGPELLLET